MRNVKPLSNFDIMDYYKNNKNFGGVYSRDSEVNWKKDKFYIINTDTKIGKGYHWVMLYKNKYYFDSYGVEPLDSLRKYIRYYNFYRVQEIGTNTCGYFCIYVINELEKNRNYIDILTDFDANNFIKNEKFIISKFNIN